MNIWQHINSLFYSKKNEFACEDYDAQQTFQPYMINRWLSFYSKELAVFTNNTLNKFSQVFEGKEETYRFYHHLILSLKFKKIQYIKKTKKEKEKKMEEDEKKIALLANSKRISQREIKEALAFFD